METVIQAVFNNENAAFKARQALLNLDAGFVISVEESYIIHKNKSGVINIPSADDDTGAGMIGGSLVGGLIGLLAGPVGLAVGATSGLLLGAAGDAAQAGDRDDSLTYYGQRLQPGQSLLVAHVWEDDVSDVNAVLRPYTSMISRVDVDAELSRAERAEAVEYDRKIREMEARADAADAADKLEWNAKVTEWKQKRENAKQRRNQKSTERKNNYSKWVNNQKQKYNDWSSQQDAKRDARKRESLQNRIDKEEEKLADLQTEKTFL